jgi:hypothetical protein
MATWLTAAEIRQQFVVGEARLEAFARRGNLPCRRLPDGATLYDAEVVAGFFRSHRGTISVRASTGPSMGLLGVTKLGEKPAETLTPSGIFPLDGRETRRRALRLASSRGIVDAPITIPSARPTLKIAR